MSAPGPDAAPAQPARVAAAGHRPPSRHLPRSLDGGGPRNEFPEVQRARLLSTLVQTVAEVGYPQLSITRIVSRAGVSRRTFYEHFSDQEDAFLAAFDEAVAQIGAAAGEAYAEEGAWHERLRAGLEVVLSTFDEEPALARVCVMEAQRAGPRMLERRAQVLDRLARIVDEGRRGGRGLRGSGPPPLTAHSLVAGALSVVHDRLLAPTPQRLTKLVGPLMSMIVFPYLGPAAAAREIRRPGRNLRRPRNLTKLERPTGNPLRDLGTRLTYRTIKVLGFVADHPGASNREIADGAGVADQGQISKLLIRLASLDLIENVVETPGRGFANAWQITTKGQEIRHAVKL